MNTLSVYDVLRASFRTYRKNFWFFTVFTLVFCSAFFVALSVNQSAAEVGGMGILFFAALIFFLVSFFLLVWAMRVGIAAVDGKPLEPRAIFADIVPQSWEIVWKLAAAGSFLFFVFASFLLPFLSVVLFLDAASPEVFLATGVAVRSGMMAAFILATLLFVVSFVYLCVRFSLVPYFVVDKTLGILDALRASWEATGQAFWKLLVLFSLGLAINALGAFFFYGILLASIPMTLLAFAYTYRKLGFEKNAVST
jgi:uncharacterized membrane protein